MAMDRTGVWRPACDIEGCPHDVDDAGLVEVMVLVAGEIQTARIRVCISHLRRCLQPAEPVAA